jgi:UDP:flavonoid glycosyltransferase YjiC (YdhE family)
MVLAPVLADQPRNAARIAALGAGLVLKERSADALREAISTVLGDRRFAVAAARVAAEIAMLPPVQEAVAFLEQQAR